MKILIGMSGGLDSTYAAYLLAAQGHEVLGAALRMHAHTPVEDAVLAAKQAGIALVILDASARFEACVVERFVSDYASGRTPNPCVLCNREVKFACLCEYARANGFDAVATGHYSSVGEEGGRFFIRRAVDARKDQSYALWNLTQEELSMLYLPLAGANKEQIRQLAQKAGLSAAQSKESMENCFIPDNDYARFLASRGVQSAEGNFLDRAGNVVGRHRGIIHYTVGQRKGLGLSMGRPVFVTAIDPLRQTVTVGDGSDLMTEAATVTQLNFQKRPPLPGTFDAQVKIRYAAPPVQARVTVSSDLQTAQLRFASPVRAVTPGQSAVCYEGEDILMGGILESV